MRRLLLLLPLCALIFSPGADKDAEKRRPLDLKPFVDDDKPLPDAETLEQLAKKDPIAFLEYCLRRYQREVKGYTCTFQKQERIDKKLHPSEIIAVTFRQDPHSVLFRWKQGARLAEAALYVEGENKKDKDGNQKSWMVAHPSGIAGKLVKFVDRDPDDPEVKQSARYSLLEFGIEKAMQRTLGTWKNAQNKGELHVEYLGETKLKEAGNRTCYKLRRTKYAEPEEHDGVTELTIYIDKETWLQVGSVLKGNDDQYIAQYYFRDIKLNPEFTAETFKKEALTK
jgi:hypothetical protein